MNTDLTRQQVESYQRDGFLVIDGFLSPDELNELRGAVTESVDEMAKLGGQRIAGEGNKKFADGKDDYYSRVFLQRLNLWKINSTIKEYFLNSAIGEMMCRLSGAEGIRVWHDQTLQKPPWGNPTAWHLDCPYWSFHSRDAISIWVALDDATLQNGCMHFLPGSHKLANFENVGIGQDMAALFEVYPAFKRIDAVHAEMKAGSAGIHSGLTAHAAGPNMTPRLRRAMTCAYMPDGSTFNGKRNILSEQQLAKLTVGDVLNDDDQTPLIWSSKMAVAAR